MKIALKFYFNIVLLYPDSYKFTKPGNVPGFVNHIYLYKLLNYLTGGVVPVPFVGGVTVVPLEAGGVVLVPFIGGVTVVPFNGVLVPFEPSTGVVLFKGTVLFTGGTVFVEFNGVVVLPLFNGVLFVPFVGGLIVFPFVPFTEELLVPLVGKELFKSAGVVSRVETTLLNPVNGFALLTVAHKAVQTTIA